MFQHFPHRRDLAFAYKEGTHITDVGDIRELLSKYDTLRQIFQNSLSPKTGSSDEFWGTTIDFLVYDYEDKKVDVLDFMFEEMRTSVFDNKSAVFTLFIHALIEAKIAGCDKLLQKLPISLPTRFTNSRPQVHDDMLHLVHKKPSPRKVSVATKVGGSSS